MSETTLEGLDQDAIRRRAYEISESESAGTADENWRRAERELLADAGVLYDTGDLRLQRLEMALTRAAQHGSVVWRLRLARGEMIEAAAPDDPDRLPGEIAGLVARAIGHEPVAPAPVLRLDPGLLRLGQLLAAQAHALLTHEPGVRIGADPENLHRHRVAARRSRAFLHATRNSTNPAWRDPLNDTLRALAAVTGPVRDLDVLIEQVRTELAGLGDDERYGAERLLERLDADRVQAREPLLTTLASTPYCELVDRLSEPPRLAAGVEAVPLDETAARELRRLLKTLRRLGAKPADGELHALRITLKRARYAAELAGPGEKDRDRFLVDARRLQRVLGDHQDAAVAEKRLRELAARESDPAAAFVAGRLAERQRARRKHAAATLPSACRRLRRLSR
jgi:CHAD domain-containing protein